jgi:glycosyltransferase involved in cell wall biosynthesis
MLRLPGDTTVAWAVFDAEWYRAAYPDTCELAEPHAVLGFYLEQGQQRGDSPNPWFDERWHLAAHPEVAAAVRAGQVESGFDAYCRGGFTARSPHWLFIEGRYRRLNADLNDAALVADNNANGYDHYLKHGNRESRAGHPLFDSQMYRAQLDASQRAEADRVGPYPHYLKHVWAHDGERRTTIRFDPLLYLHRYPAVAEAIEQGQWLCALHHYLCNETPTNFDPLPEFSESDYLSRYVDIAEAVQSKARRNGYDHFLTNGAAELRSPINWIDLHYYLNEHPSVQADLQARRARDAFEHYLAIGRGQGLAPALPPEEHVTEKQAHALYRRRADVILAAVSRTPLDFTCESEPAVSVLMVTHAQSSQTLRALSELRQHWSGELQLILVQSGGSDENLTRHVRGARLLHFDNDIGSVRARNAALHCVTADTVLFLGAETELLPGAMATALRRLASDAGAGAVGGKLIRGHGRLESAGGIIWRDGMTHRYLSDASPDLPEANFMRTVDFCSTDFLLVRARLLRELEGFDDELPEGDLPAADMCLRIAASGYKVVYDSSIAAYQFGRAATGAEAVALADRGHQHFVRKHMNYLRFRYIPDRRVEVFARSTDAKRRVLFIDDMIPMRWIGSGFVRSTDVIDVMASLGYGITVYPLAPNRFSLRNVYADIPDSVEVMHDRDIDGLAAFLTARQGYYDAVWVARTHNLDRILPLLDRITAGSGRPPRIVLDTEAIASFRDAARAVVSGRNDFDLDAAVIREFSNAHSCQSIVAVNGAEAQRLRSLGIADVTVLGHLCRPQPTGRAFADRAGMLFVGAIHEADSPNYDSLLWFIREVLPIVEQSLGWETRLTVAGYLAADVSLDQFRDHPRVTLRGTVAELERLYDSHRVFVAPTRFAAGAPYKVHEAAAFGLPVVATELLREQLGWENGTDLLAAPASDPAEFAKHIVTFYRDPSEWEKVRANALARIQAEHGRAPYAAAIQHALGV